jgi:mannan endo-1,4-beta-mannosidase
MDNRRHQGLIDGQRPGRHQQYPRASTRRHRAGLETTIVAAVVAVTIIAIFTLHNTRHSALARHPVPKRQSLLLPITPDSYIGLYSHGVPDSYTGITAFTTATGVKPRVVVYYSGWREPFQITFARAAANEGAVPLVQIDPEHINIAAIASGRYDDYLTTYADAVRAYHHPVILSFGHEMNGYWYSWGYTHTSPAVFAAAWRHIVTLFRTSKTGNVTWLWTINTIHKQTRVPAPGPWWPGDSFVNWVGIDGYFMDSPSTFSSVFGPTIVYVRTLTHHPIFIAETSATPIANQPAKIAELFNGIHLYDLLGFVWFDSNNEWDWRLRGPAAIAAFRHGASAYFGYKL